MRTRTLAVAASGVSAAVLAASGITYASTDGSTPANPSARRASLAARQAAPAAAPSASGNASSSAQQAAQPVPQAAPAAAPSGSGTAGGEKNAASEKNAGGEKDEDRGREGGGRDRERGHEEGRIYFNERTYSAATEGCISAASGLGSSSFSIFNDSRKTVEVFRGFSCDGGSPVATVGPWGATDGVVTNSGRPSLFGDDGAVGSFRVIREYDEW